MSNTQCFKQFLIVLLLLFTGRMAAQSFETGGLLGVEYEMKILKGWQWGAEAEARFDENFTHFNRFKVAVGTDYTFWKKRIKIGVGYGYLNYHKDDYFESRHRLTGSLTLAEKFGNWKLSYRAVFQSTFRDDRRGDDAKGRRRRIRGGVRIHAGCGACVRRMRQAHGLHARRRQRQVRGDRRG